MKSIIKTTITAAALVLGMAILAPSAVVVAQEGDGGGSDTTSAGSTIQDAVNDIGGDQNTTELKDVVKTILNVLLYFIGALSVIMIIYGGFKYITSGGDSSGVSSAKNTIMYAVIGLIVATLAFTLVNFVLGVFNDEQDAAPRTGRNVGNTARDAVGRP